MVIQLSPGRDDDYHLFADVITLSKSLFQDKQKMEDGDFQSALRIKLNRYADYYDLIIVDSQSNPGVPTICLDEQCAEQNLLLFHYNSNSEFSSLLTSIMEYLDWIQAAKPLWGCILIGGKSSRMGRPKHLLMDNGGITWVEKQTAKLAKITDEVVLSGRGEVPASLRHMTRINDIANADGPLAGILATMRWHPGVSWLFCACDMPQIERSAIKWLLSKRKPGRWGIVPIHPVSGRLEPLFALYDRQCRHLFEALLDSGELRLRSISDNQKIYTPKLPEKFARALENCNTPGDIKRLYPDKI